MILRIGHLSTFYHTSILMIASGTLGAHAEWKLFSTGPAIVNAFEQNEIDLAYIGLPPAIIGIDRGLDIKCIAGGHMEGTVLCAGSHFRGYPQLSGLEEILKQFSGSRIGVPGRGSIHDVIISECLRKFHLTREIEVMNYQWADQVLDAIHRGEVAAAAGTPALATAVVRFAQGKILYPPSALWPGNPSYGILVKHNVLVREDKALERFLLMHEDATSFLRNSPREAAQTISDFVGIVDQAFVLDTLRVSPRYCACLSAEYMSSSMDFVKVLKKLEYIGREISSEEIFDDRLIKKTHPEADHYGESMSSG